MRTPLLALALVLALSGCKGKDKDLPAFGGSAEPVAQTDAPGGSGSATAVAPCKDVEIALAKAGHVVRRDADQPVKLDELKAALTTLATACKGAVVVSANDDMDYQSMITAMDVAKAAGFSDIMLQATGAPATRTAPPPSTPPAITNAPIVQVSTTEVSLIIGGDKPVVIGEVGDVGAKHLDEAFGKVPNKRDGTPVIVQADAGTSAKTINAIIAAGKRAGFDDFLFAIKNR